MPPPPPTPDAVGAPAAPATPAAEAPGIGHVALATAPGITLQARRSGRADQPGARRVLLLHGFPEAAFIWDPVLAALAPRALCLAPDQRGYGASSRPAAQEAYRAKHLVADIAALIDQLAPAPGAPIDLLVAHDWGGGIAWNAAALLPQRIRRLVIINAPHAGAMRRELLRNPAQRAASQYMNDLVQPDAAERLAADDFAVLWSMFTRFGPAPWLTEAVRAQYRAVWSQGLDGALNWYRASPLRPPRSEDDAAALAALQALALPDSVLRVPVPTTVLWGEADGALLPGLVEDLQGWVPDLRVHRKPDASHWVLHEHPQWVIGQLQAVLDSLDAEDTGRQTQAASGP